ncbi:MAG: hypothetical protein AAGI14_02775 [Pseudomonadota bacterium]
MRTIICMNWGTRYGAEFVNRLYRACRRNMTGEFRFICFTDTSDGFDESVDAQPLPEINLPERVRWSPWRKLAVWQTPLAGLEGDVLFLDLDLVITGPLDEFFAYKPGEYCVIENWTQKGGGIGNTSVFRFPVGRYSQLFDEFNADPEAVVGSIRIEQVYISRFIEEQHYWPSEWCVSFKHSLMPKFPMNWFKVPELPSEARVVAFTGHPDPDEARDGAWPAPWYKRHYKHVKPTPWIAEHWQ